MKNLFGFLLLFAMALPVAAQQVADEQFDPPNTQPAFAVGKGPIVAIDEAHTNFHTLTGRFQAFAKHLRKDGYILQANTKPFSAAGLKLVSILVISNALHESNATDWKLPTPSAFRPEEIAAVKTWIEAGGSLLLIADHMPMAGAATDLGKALGIEFSNGFAIEGGDRGPMFFRASDKSLREHPILHGRNASEDISEVATFTGSAFKGDGLQPLFVFRAKTDSLEPDVAWQFTETTKKVSVEGWYQGATRRLGKGRIAVFGEAAMFTAQLAGPNRMPVGMNSPMAKSNPQFVLNVVHWLSGVLDGKGTAASTPSKSIAAGENLVGDWKGTSICKARPGICHDEVVVYHIKPSGKADGYSVRADKIINGELEDMGVLECTFAPKETTLTCHYRPTDSWTFKLTGDTMKGTLIIPDNVLLRVIDLKKVKSDWRKE
ncbi:MAG TPA: DUF4350 domain-containing protein [Terriglobales bacterium]|nr:DUF4350 domain-containing protein [Terriglobales bacterium]